MCFDLVGIDNSDCVKTEGGIVRSAVVGASAIDLTGITFNAAGGITAMVAATPGEVVEYIYDDDESAFHNSTGERAGNQHKSNHESFFKFEGLDEAKLAEANAMADCCAQIIVHEYANGVQVVQGIDAIDDGVGGLTARLSRVRAKPTVSSLSGTGADADRLEVTTNSISRNPAIWLDRTLFDIDAFLAL